MVVGIETLITPLVSLYVGGFDCSWFEAFEVSNSYIQRLRCFESSRLAKMLPAIFLT